MSHKIKQYNKHEMVSLVHTEGITESDYTYLTSLNMDATVGDDTTAKWITPVGVLVIQTPNYPTGYFINPGVGVVLIINEVESLLDYDFVSALHPIADADVYLWTTAEWKDDDQPLGLCGEWYRRDTYKDDMKPFNGVRLGWEDLPI